MPLISVIVPVYKVEPYLCRCVDSILAQTFTDFELILVDDGSPDNCGAICDEYAKKDSRVYVIHQENKGLSAARNAGIDWVFANSNSEWLNFVDSDDWVHPQMLERLYRAAIEHDVGISVCGFIGTTEDVQWANADTAQVKLWPVEQYYVQRGVNATVAVCKLYDKECFANIRYPVGKIHEDEYVTYRILFEYEQIAVIETPMYAYFENPEGITKSSWSFKKLDVLEALQERIDYFGQRKNAGMQQLAYREFEARKALLTLEARKNHLYHRYPKEYRMCFFNATRAIEKHLGTDKYESMVYMYYPRFIVAQAWTRKLRQLMLGNGLLGRIRIALEEKREKNITQKLSLVCIAKYEEAYIKEWVEFHLLQGIDRIYVYDNDSPDTMKEVLQPYIDAGKVVYTFFPGKARQLDAYNDAIRRFKHETKYMAFIDCDEFLLPERPGVSLIDTIEEIMKQDKNSGGIAVNWRMYGSSGLLRKPEGLVIDNYLYRGDGAAKGNDCIKTIANPRLIKSYDQVHFPTYYAGIHSVNEDGKPVYGWSNPCAETKKIRINHYFTKSKEEWIVRRSHGKADAAADYPRTIDEFYEHDHHDIYDPIMLPYAKALREKGLKE